MPLATNCPSGSSWVTRGGKLVCVNAGGVEVPPVTSGPTTPVVQPSVGGPVMPGGSTSGNTYTSLPGRGTSGIPGGAGQTGTGSKGVPWWVSGGAALLGGILGVVGKKKQNAATQQEAARLEAEDRARAAGKAHLIRGILNANGYGSMMTDDQILAMITKTGARPNTAGNILQSVGGQVQGIGSTLLLDTYDRNRPDPRAPVRPTAASVGSSIPGSATTAAPSSAAADPAASQAFWDELNRMIHDDPTLGN